MPRASDTGLAARRKRLERVLAGAVVLTLLGVVNLRLTAGGSLWLVALGCWVLVVLGALAVVVVLRRAASGGSG